MSTLENLRFYCWTANGRPVVCDRENKGKVVPFHSEAGAVRGARQMNENHEVRKIFGWVRCEVAA